MVAYVILGIAVALSLFGFGLLSMLACFFALIFARSAFPEQDVTVHWHHRHVRSTAGWGMLLQIILTIVLVVLATIHINQVSNGGLMASGGLMGIFNAVVAHYAIDHISEAVIALWLMYRTIQGIIRLQEDQVLRRQESAGRVRAGQDVQLPSSNKRPAITPSANRTRQ